MVNDMVLWSSWLMYSYDHFNHPPQTTTRAHDDAMCIACLFLLHTTELDLFRVDNIETTTITRADEQMVVLMGNMYVSGSHRKNGFVLTQNILALLDNNAALFDY